MNIPLSSSGSVWRWLAMLLAWGFFPAAMAQAADPFHMSYSGRLTEPDGKPVIGPVKIDVKFYDAETGGTPLIATPQVFTIPTLSDGMFQISFTLNEAEFHTVFNGTGETWIEVQDLSKTPPKKYDRQRFGAVPYALKTPVDGTTIKYDDDGKLTVLAIPSSVPVALAATATNANSFTTSLAGDVTGLQGATVVGKLRGKAIVGNLDAADDQKVLKWDNGSSSFKLLNDNQSGGLNPNDVTFVIIKDNEVRNADIFSAAAIDVTKIGNGDVDNAKLSFLNSVSSNVQTQISGKAATVHVHSATDVTTGQLGVARGGTGADLSATGGAKNFLKQSTSGGAVTVGTIALTDLPSGMPSGDVMNNGQNGAVTVGSNDNNALTLETNNSPRMTIDATGKVSIGTTTPTNALSVVSTTAIPAKFAGWSTIDNGGSSAGGTIQVGDANGGSYTELQFADVDKSTNLDNTSNFVGAKIHLRTNRSGTMTPGLTVDNGGMVGIGTTAPGFKLELGPMGSAQSSKANLAPDVATSTGKYDSSGTPSVNKWVFYNNPGGAAYGVGMSSAGFDFLAGDNGFNFYTGTTNVDGTGATRRLSVLTNGNVGIGSAAPLQKLEVTGNMAVGQSSTAFTYVNAFLNAGDTTLTVNSTAGFPETGYLLVKDEALSYTGITATTFTGLTRGRFGTTAASAASFTTVDNYLAIFSASSTTPRVMITGLGRIGVGVAHPWAGLSNSATQQQDASTNPVNGSGVGWTVNGYGYAGVFENTAAGAGYSSLLLKTADTSANAYLLRGESGGTSRFAVRSDGNVGVGTTAPATKLDVAGQIRSQVFNNGAGSAIDWNNGNVQYTSASCGAMTFSNMLEGGSYSLIVTGGTSGTCTFSQTAAPDTLASGVFKFSPANAATTASKSTIYSFLRAGNLVYVSWIPGF